MASASTARHLRTLYATVIKLRDRMLAAENSAATRLKALPPHRRASAQNLIHYLALRRRDLRPLQGRLAELGLSSLGRCEAHALASVECLRTALAALAGEVPSPSPKFPVNHQTGPQRLKQHADLLLGMSPAHRDARIMVTMATAAATDQQLMRDLLQAGMNLIRINCAHDDASVWRDMIANLRRAEQATGCQCLILMDLAGPKLRTGALAPGDQVVRWKPHRDHYGRVQHPARIALLAPAEGTEKAPAVPPQIDAVLPVSAAMLEIVRCGDTLSFIDARTKERRLQVVAHDGHVAIAEATATAYAEPGTLLRVWRAEKMVHEEMLGSLPPLAEPLRLASGDTLLLTQADIPGRPARRDAAGNVLAPASIPCTLPEIFHDVLPGQRIWFDDGKIGGVIREVRAEGLVVDITKARAGGVKLRSDKGINLPDSSLGLHCLTAKDRSDLAFAAQHADHIGLSFIRQASDVSEFSALLGGGSRTPGIILKIETPQAFAGLPSILLAGLATNLPLGVMVARGDLAVEVGFARLAEVQEEILWLCEAAHIPVIWGTQVLETLAKKGIATRAEVTDAAMSVRAECVMLNKGPHIVAATRFLADVLTRMHSHQTKKQTLLRRLAVSGSTKS